MAKICVVTSYLITAGGELTKLEAFLRYLQARGHICDIYYPQEGRYPRSTISWLETFPSVNRIYGTPVFDKAPHFLKIGLFARRWECVGQYDAYIAISTPLAYGLPFVRQKKPFVSWISCHFEAEVRCLPRLRLRHYLIYNQFTTSISRRQELRCGNAASHVVTLSRVSSEQVHTELGIPDRKIWTIPAPVNVHQYVPSTPRTRPQPYILSVARLERRKDFPSLLQAFRMVVQDVGDIELRIVGSGPDILYLQQLVDRLELKDHVTFLGELPQNSRDLVDEYRGASLFTLASTQEGLGIVFLEAMACGVPVVTTDSGGSADPVAHGRTGFLVPVGDWKTLASRILEVLKEPGLGKRMGDAGRKRAVAEYSFEVFNERMDSLLSEAFGVKPALQLSD